MIEVLTHFKQGSLGKNHWYFFLCLLQLWLSKIFKESQTFILIYLQIATYHEPSKSSNWRYSFSRHLQLLGPELEKVFIKPNSSISIKTKLTKYITTVFLCICFSDIDTISQLYDTVIRNLHYPNNFNTFISFISPDITINMKYFYSNQYIYCFTNPHDERELVILFNKKYDYDLRIRSYNNNKKYYHMMFNTDSMISIPFTTTNPNYSVLIRIFNTTLILAFNQLITTI